MSPDSISKLHNKNSVSESVIKNMPSIDTNSLLGKHIIRLEKWHGTSNKINKYLFIPLVMAVTIPIFAVLGLLEKTAVIAYKACKGTATRHDLKHLIAHITIFITIPFLIASYISGKYGTVLDLKNKTSDVHPIFSMINIYNLEKDVKAKDFINRNYIDPLLNNDNFTYSFSDKKTYRFLMLLKNSDYFETYSSAYKNNNINFLHIFEEAFKNNDQDALVQLSILKDDEPELLKKAQQLWKDNIAIADRGIFVKLDNFLRNSSVDLVKGLADNIINRNAEPSEKELEILSYYNGDGVALLLNQAIESGNNQYIKLLLNNYPEQINRESIRTVMFRVGELKRAGLLEEAQDFDEVLIQMLKKIKEVDDAILAEAIYSELSPTLLSIILEKGKNIEKDNIKFVDIPFYTNFKLDHPLAYADSLTPLICAVITGNFEAVRLLIENKAKISEFIFTQKEDSRSLKIRTPMQIAQLLLDQETDPIKKANYQKIYDYLSSPTMDRELKAEIPKEDVLPSNEDINIMSYNAPITVENLQEVQKKIIVASNLNSPIQFFNLKMNYTLEDLRKAYKDTLLLFHVDKLVTSDTALTNSINQGINNIYATLRLNLEKRH